MCNRQLTEFQNPIQERILMRGIVMENNQTLYLRLRGPLQRIQEGAMSQQETLSS
jgi:hypothetical protein